VTAHPWRPTPQQIRAAAGRKVPDLLAPRLSVLFVGINPGLYSGAVGHHFARPGNRFWKVLQLAGFTARVLSPFDERRLLDLGLGVTNLVDRATAAAAELSTAELVRGAHRLRRKVVRQRPAFVAFLGVGAYRSAMSRPAAGVGPQPETMGDAAIWLLPNPSGLNAHYQLPELTRAFAALRIAVASAARQRRARGPRAASAPGARSRRAR
jgi:TDG/mug DNA glycosylase family protein